MSIRQAAEKVFPGEFQMCNEVEIKEMEIGDAFKHEGDYHIIVGYLPGPRLVNTFNMTQKKKDQVCGLKEAEKVNVHFI